MIIGNYTKTKQIILLVTSILFGIIPSCILFFMNKDLIMGIMLLGIAFGVVSLNYFYSKMYNIRLEDNHVAISNLYKKRNIPYTEFTSVLTTGQISIYSVFCYFLPSLFYLKLNNGEKLYFERNPKRYLDLLFPFNGKRVAKEFEEEINKVMKTLLIFCLYIFFFTSCTNSEIKDIENFSELGLKNKIIYNTRYDEWQSFIGDGCAVALYSIKPEYQPVIYSEIKANGWNSFSEENEEYPYSSDFELQKYKIEKNQYWKKGFYKRIDKNNEIHSIIIDTTNNTLLYYNNTLLYYYVFY